MSAFLDNARSILETAEAAERQGQEPGDLAILVCSDGGLRLVTEPAEWSMKALAWEYGATMSYRVKHAGGRVRVEGQSAGQTCILESEPAAAARQLLAGWPRYLLAAA
ncbi:MAG: hypothetical protein ACRD8O_14395 [Bryobacteraceae bacterium]